MSFQPVNLGEGYWLQADDYQWILCRERVSRTGEPVLDKRTHKPKYDSVGYYPSLPQLLRELGERRLRNTHVDEWHRVVEQMDGICAQLTGFLSTKWVRSS